jgi:hypothetical protein
MLQRVTSDLLRLTESDLFRRGKRTRSAVSADTTMKSSDVEIIDVKEDEGDV